jgi:hypothetical protein
MSRTYAILPVSAACYEETVALCTLALWGDLNARRELQRREHGTACNGCAERLPTRACCVTGAPLHRGPEFTFACRAP